MGFDPQWTRYVGDRLKSGSSPIFKKKMHGIEEVWNVLMFEMNKCIYVYIVLIEFVDEESKQGSRKFEN